MWLELIAMMGSGALLAIVGVIMALQIGKKNWPYLFVNVEERQGGIVTELLKGKEMKLHNRKKQFVVKKLIMENGIGALFQKPTLTNFPNKHLSIIKKSGGVVLITYSPAENTYLPVSLLKDEESIGAIVQAVDDRNWFKSTIEGLMKQEILRPKRNWEKWAPALVIGAGVVCVMILIIGNMIISQNTLEIMSQLTGIKDAVVGVQTISGSASNAIY